MAPAGMAATGGPSSQAFRDHEIDQRILPELNADDLKELGVGAIGHNRLLLKAIADLPSGDGRAATTGSPAAPASFAVAESERRQLTVIFCDLVGSTALSAHFDPEDLREIFGASHRAVADTVGRFAGFVTKYMGDGVLIYFGYPRAHEDDAERASGPGSRRSEAAAHLASRPATRNIHAPWSPTRSIIVLSKSPRPAAAGRLCRKRSASAYDAGISADGSPVRRAWACRTGGPRTVSGV